MKIPELKPNECIVLYEDYFCIDHLTGEWSDNFQIFSSTEEAVKFIESIKGKWNYTNVCGPLKLA